jgi:NADPH2:quinone reductase
MRAVAVQAFGPPDGLAVIDRPDPSPAEGQVLIATEAIGVGGVDAVIRRGTLADYGFREGHVPGGEIAGTVAAVGDNVDTAWVGQRVWAFTGLGGGYAEQAVAPVATLVPRPAGIMAVQLAARGAASAVTVTTSSPSRGDRLRQLGATHVADRAGQAGPGGPAGYDVIIDVVAGPDLPSFFARLRPGGRMVAVGVVAGYPPPDFGMAMFAAFQKSLSFATFSADTVRWPERRAAVAELFAAAVRGELRAVVHEQLSLEQAALAHQQMDAGEVFGRIVLVPQGR